MKFALAKETKRSSFATRPVAAETRRRLSEALPEARDDRVLEIDLSGVEALTISFADELVAKLAAERRAYGPPDRFLLVSNASAEVAETIEVALERRGLFIVHRRSDASLELLGAPDHLKETFAAAVELREFSTRVLAERLGLKLPAANNRVKALADAGAVARSRHAPVRGGKQYEYRVAA